MIQPDLYHLTVDGNLYEVNLALVLYIYNWKYYLKIP